MGGNLIFSVDVLIEVSYDDDTYSLKTPTHFGSVLLYFLYVLQLSEVGASLSLFELGSMRINPDHYNIKDVYNYLDKATPAVFILPNPRTISVEGTKGKSLPHLYIFVVLLFWMTYYMCFIKIYILVSILYNYLH